MSNMKLPKQTQQKLAKMRFSEEYLCPTDIMELSYNQALTDVEPIILEAIEAERERMKEIVLDQSESQGWDRYDHACADILKALTQNKV